MEGRLDVFWLLLVTPLPSTEVLGCPEIIILSKNLPEEDLKITPRNILTRQGGEQRGKENLQYFTQN